MARLSQEYMVVVIILGALGVMYVYFFHFSHFLMQIKVRRVSQSKRFLILSKNTDPDKDTNDEPEAAFSRKRISHRAPRRLLSGIRRLAYKLFLS